jgi:hypothetical protein
MVDAERSRQMKPIRSFGLWLTLLVLLTLSCQAVTGLVKGNATATPLRPTSTEAPGANPTPTERPQAGPTATPPPASNAGTPTLGTVAETKAALQASPDSVLEALANERYTASDLAQMNKTFPFTIDLTGDDPALWEFGWCATTTAILTDNLKHISPQFLMNSVPVDIGKFYAFDSQSTDSQSNATLQCHSYAVLVSHWPAGETLLQTRVTFDAKLNDGIGDYQPGAQTFDYTVTRP